MMRMDDPFRGSPSAGTGREERGSEANTFREPTSELETTSRTTGRVTVREVMTSAVQSCRPEDTLAAAALKMSRADCRFLPVVDAARHPVGVITDGDICLLGATGPRRLRDMTVREAMSHRVFTCRPDDDIQGILQTMRRERIRHLPVVGPEGVLEGVVSLTDLILCAEERHGISDPICREIAATVREIAQKHPAGRVVRVHPFVED